MGGTERSGDGLRMVRRVSVGGTERCLSICGLYGWEGLGGLGPGCEWLAGLVWEGWEVMGWVVLINIALINSAPSTNNECL